MKNVEWLIMNADDLGERKFCEFVFCAVNGRDCEIGECQECELRRVSAVNGRDCEIGECQECELRRVRTILKALSAEHEEREGD